MDKEQKEKEMDGEQNIGDEMEFVDNLTGQRVWGTVEYDTSWIMNENLASELIWMQEPTVDKGQDLLKAWNRMAMERGGNSIAM